MKRPRVAFEGWLFFVTDGGLADCLDARSGREIWRSTGEAGLDAALPPKDVHRQIECGLSHGRGRPC